MIDKFVKVTPLVCGYLTAERDGRPGYSNLVYVQRLREQNYPHNTAGIWLKVEEARALRDWLNKALGDEP